MSILFLTKIIKILTSFLNDADFCDFSAFFDTILPILSAPQKCAINSVANCFEMWYT